MQHPTRLLHALLALAVLVAWAGAAAPASAQPSPTEVIRSRNQVVQRILQAHPGDTVTGPDAERLKDVINSLMDF